MILWHLGLATLIVYVTLGRRRVDYRFILIGAVLPDAVDGILNVAWLHEPAGRSIAHTILAVIVVTVVILLAFKGERRLSVFGIGVGWLLHLVGDGMWQAPRTFLWPAFGSRFALRPPEPYSWDLLTHPFGHLATWGGELAGLAVLAWFWVAFRLGEEGRARLFLGDGYLRP
jgi:branched-subunit amino acid transport protein AzlD